jgi:hypothetical protein
MDQEAKDEMFLAVLNSAILMVIMRLSFLPSSILPSISHTPPLSIGATLLETKFTNSRWHLELPDCASLPQIN